MGYYVFRGSFKGPCRDSFFLGYPFRDSLLGYYDYVFRDSLCFGVPLRLLLGIPLCLGTP